MYVAPPSGHFMINLICLTTKNDTDPVTIDGIPNENTIFFFQIFWSGRKVVDRLLKFEKKRFCFHLGFHLS